MVNFTYNHFPHLSREVPMKYIITTLALALCLTSCSSKRPSKAAFTKAINAYYVQQPPAIAGSDFSFPFVYHESLKRYGTPSAEAVEALLKAGLVAPVGDTTINLGYVSLDLNSPRNNRKVQAKKYDCSANGRKYFRKSKDGASVFGDSQEGFAFANESVNKIVDFSKPADYMGKVVSEVKYTTSLSKFAGWSKLPEVRNAFPVIQQYLSPEYEKSVKSAVLVLTSKGWVHSAMFDGTN
jgi:hypothetical protein